MVSLTDRPLVYVITNAVVYLVLRGMEGEEKFVPLNWGQL